MQKSFKLIHILIVTVSIRTFQDIFQYQSQISQLLTKPQQTMSLRATPATLCGVNSGSEAISSGLPRRQVPDGT